MTDSETENTADDALAVIGRRLAKAREAAGKDVRAVATELHLRVEVIQALESGDEAALPAAAFIRGYVRSYARFVGLDDAALVAGLPQAVEHRPVPRKSGKKYYRAPSLRPGRILGWGLLVLLLVLLVLFGAPVLERLWSGRDVEPVDNSLRLPQSGVDAGDSALVLPGETEGDSPVVSRADDGGAPVSVPPASESATLKQAVPLPVPASSATTGPAELVLRFTQDSWVEMTAGDRKLVVGTQRAGTERTVRVEPPVDILLGNAPGVEIRWRGKPLDITPYQRGKVARIKLEH